MAVVEFVKAKDASVQVWAELKTEAADFAANEQALSSYLYASIVNQESFCRALASHLAEKLATPEVSAIHLRSLFLEVYRADEDVIDAAAQDLIAVHERDPACHTYLQCFLYFKGFMALQTHRVAHALYQQDRRFLAYHLQNRSSELFNVDIHPAAKFGTGIMLDHASGLVGFKFVV